MTKNPRYDGCQKGLTSMVYKFFDKNSSGEAIAIPQNEQLSEKLHKPIIRKFLKRKVYSSFIDNIWSVDKEFRFFYVLLIFLVNIHGLFL